MSEKVRTIRLYGKLGAKFGRTFKLAVNSPREAVRALCMLLPGFEAYMMNAHREGIGFSVFVGKENLTPEQLEYPVGNADIRIAPVITGAKRAGVFNIIAGIVVIAASAVYGWYTQDWSGAYQGMMYGAAMAIGGVIQMLAPQPKGLGSKDSSENQGSYSFNGPVNTQAQGNPVPLLYGRLIVGSAVISAGIKAVDIYIPQQHSGYGGGFKRFIDDAIDIAKNNSTS